MYVNKKTYSIKKLQQFVVALNLYKTFFEKQLAKLQVNDLACVYLQVELKKISRLLGQYNQILTALKSPEKRFKKLCQDTLNAVAYYEKENPNHSEQRTNSLTMVKEYVSLLATSKETADEKYAQLAKFIASQLAAVELDHNKNRFSRFFTYSNLAKAYMQVLRDNFIPCEQKSSEQPSFFHEPRAI